MPTARIIRGVLGNFLGTYTSRYSDYDGYWLFGFLVADLEELCINLLAPVADEPDSALGVAIRIARVKFEDQVRKAGLVLSQVREARLTLRKLPGSAGGWVNDHPCQGYNVSFLAEAVTDSGHRYQQQRVLFVAPHNPELEIRSARAA